MKKGPPQLRGVVFPASEHSERTRSLREHRPAGEFHPPDRAPMTAFDALGEIGRLKGKPIRRAGAQDAIAPNVEHRPRRVRRSLDAHHRVPRHSVRRGRSGGFGNQVHGAVVDCGSIQIKRPDRGVVATPKPPARARAIHRRTHDGVMIDCGIRESASGIVRPRSRRDQRSGRAC